MKSELREKRETEILYKLQKNVINGLTNGAIERERKTSRLNMMLLVCVPLSILLNIYALTRPQTVVDIVEIAPWGEAKYVNDASQLVYNEGSIPEISREWQIREFITNLRSLSTDQDVVYGNYTKCYASATKELGKKLTKQIQDNEWLKEIGQIKRVIQIETVIKVSEYSYQADWRETIMNVAGEIKGTIRMRGVVTIKLTKPTQEKALSNPLGIYLTDYEMKEIQQGIK